MSNNSNLHRARKARNDEFYSMLSDIENELSHYKEYFNGKVVYCNCDDARESNFFKYFSMNFEFLGLKKLIATGYKKNGQGVKLVYDGDKNGNKTVDDEEVKVEELEGDGDFRSEECVELLKQADIVVTNPPFSLASLYMQQLVEHGKKFLIIGPLNLIKYKDTFPYFMKGQAWPGVNWVKSFTEPDGKIMKMGNVVWYTNLDHKKRHEKIVCIEKYDPAKYPKFDNYDAVEVGKYTDIPKDYAGVMGVPISYLMHHNPEQFEIVGTTENGLCDKALWIHPEEKHNEPFIDGKKKYTRILIKRKPVGENAETPAA